MSAQLSAAIDPNRVLPDISVTASDRRLRHSTRTSHQFDDMQCRHNGDYRAVNDAPPGAASLHHETCTVRRHEWRRHHIRYGRSGSVSGADHDVSERRFHKNKWRETGGDGGLQVSGAVAFSSYLIRTADGDSDDDVRSPDTAVSTKRMDVPGESHGGGRRHASVRNRSAKVVADDKGSADVWMVLRRTLLAGLGYDIDVYVSGNVSSARLFGSKVSVLAECANRTRTDQCKITLRER